MRLWDERGNDNTGGSRFLYRSSMKMDAGGIMSVIQMEVLTEVSVMAS